MLDGVRYRYAEDTYGLVAEAVEDYAELYSVHKNNDYCEEADDARARLKAWVGIVHGTFHGAGRVQKEPLKAPF